jgi:hypothetical protein
LPIGTLEPNAIGLYDMLGGVAQFVHDLYGLRLPDGTRHGEVGGFVTRGGHWQTPQRAIGIAQRSEVAAYTISGETRNPLNGFRLALSLPVAWSDSADSPDDGETTSRAWRAAVTAAYQTATSANSEAAGSLQAVKTGLQQLRQESGGDKLEQHVAEVEDSLRRATAQLNDAAKQLNAEKIRAAILLASYVRSNGDGIARNMVELDRMKSELRQLHDQAQIGAAIDHLMRNNREETRLLAATFDFYVASVATLARLPADDVNAGVDAAIAEFGRRGLPGLRAISAAVQADIVTTIANHGTISDSMRNQWLYEIDRSRQAREKAARSPF